MVKAFYNDVLIAETNNPIELEGNYYFPSQDVKMEYLEASDYHTVCPWKGNASYYDVVVNGQTDKNSAWYYPEPSPKAQMIKGFIAFWQNVKVVNE